MYTKNTHYLKADNARLLEMNGNQQYGNIRREPHPVLIHTSKYIFKSRRKRGTWQKQTWRERARPIPSTKYNQNKDSWSGHPEAVTARVPQKKTLNLQLHSINYYFSRCFFANWVCPMCPPQTHWRIWAKLRKWRACEQCARHSRSISRWVKGGGIS